MTAVNKSEVSGPIYLELTKAFEPVDENILLKKLTSCFQNLCSLPFFEP